MFDRSNPGRYYHVDFHDADDIHRTPDSASHSDIVGSFEELCFLAQGRTFIIRGPATATEYMDNLKLQLA